MTFTTADGRVLDLGAMTADERAFLERCLALYRAAAPFEQLASLVDSAENPLTRTTGGRVTPAVWNSPVFQALRDLEGRLGIRQGKLAPASGEDVAGDPLTDSRSIARA